MIRRRRIIFLLALAFTSIFLYGHIEYPANQQHPDEITAIIRQIQTENGFAYSHPLENSCRYPILEPEDPNLRQYIKHGRKVVCNQVQVDFVTWDSDRGVLKVDQDLVKYVYNDTVRCYYQTFTGGVLPHHMAIVPLMKWTYLDGEVEIDQDIVRVECNTSSPNARVYRFAFSQVAKVENGETRFESSSLGKLSLDILVIDSTALNMFRRHAHQSWDYMVTKMGFFVFDGFTKVGDNSLVNLIPLLSGLRYKDTAPDMTSDVPMNKPVDSEAVPFLWHLFKAKNCATMFNDDIAHPLRGFMNYPTEETPGFKSKPAHHFYRSWHLYHRGKPISNSSLYCFGNEQYYKQQLALTRQMIQKYNDTCHFSFNFLTDLTHDDPNMLEVLDEEVLRILRESYEGGHLKNTALVIMGDHGNRIELIRYSYLGRIEERMPLFALYLPEEFRRENPEVVRNLRINQHRLVTHFDAHEMFRDILEGDFSGKTLEKESKKESKVPKKLRPKHGISLFRPIPMKRNCTQANIPVNFCVCMGQNRSLVNSDSGNDSLLRSTTEDLISQWIFDKFSQEIIKCPGEKVSIVLTNVSALTTSQYVQHGIRYVSDKEDMKSLQKWLIGAIEYLDVEFVVDVLGIGGIAQVQHNKAFKNLSLTVDPLVQVKPGLKRCKIN